MRRVRRYLSNALCCSLEDEDKIREAVTSRVDELGLLRPVVNPLEWDYVGVLSTEAQAFALQVRERAIPVISC